MSLTHDLAPESEAASAAVAAEALQIPLEAPGRDQLSSELDHLTSHGLPDRRRDIAAQQQHLDDLRRDLANLHHGRGRWNDRPEGRAIQALNTATRRLQVAEHAPHTATRLAGPRARKALRDAQAEVAATEQAWTRIVRPTIDRLDSEITLARHQLADLEHEQHAHDTWLTEHPEQALRIGALQRRDHPIEAHLRDQLDRLQSKVTQHPDLSQDPPGLSP